MVKMLGKVAPVLFVALASVSLVSSQSAATQESTKQTKAEKKQAKAAQRNKTAASSNEAVEQEQAARQPCTPAASVEHASATNEKAAGAHAYFRSLASRSDCVAAYGLRKQTELDSVNTAGKRSDKKRPVVYDPAQDAARVEIYAPSTTDIKGKMLPIGINSGSMLLTWEFKFDENFRFVKEGNVSRHKTWRINPGPWLAVRTDYKHASRQGKFAELLFSMPAKRFLGPGARRGAPGWFGEMLQPQRATFYFEPDTWVRVWIFVDGLDKDVCYLSVWAADEKRDPVQLYDKVALIPNANGIGNFQIEYDTSGDTANNPKEMHAWNRNVVVLHNIPSAEVTGLLKRPLAR
jgi:hypothetical protein